MDPTAGGPSMHLVLSAESVPHFVEGVSLVLSRWTALQMAVEDGWGGKDSRQKSQELEAGIVSWFIQSKEPLYIDDLERMLEESMVLSFNTEIDDGSVGEVAEQLMIIHEECLEGNYASIERLRMSKPGTHAVSQSLRMMDENEDESSDDEEASDMMMVDDLKLKPVVGGEKNPKQVVDEDGWSVVPSRKSKGKRAG
ncbi:unnamed protein product [Spirodela intermedia]|uniref:Uncharacterized protein n=1 Tax=Spirodela intermedia TaxID=51605 RepID=A0A7I8JJ01_SPIIN|nr:unnamed protein product [Spirodela intermedia]CAA6670090.1 unnamed protein product [Spirodela intermedia]